MSLSLSGFVVGDRMLGKKLRFVDIVCVDILGPVEPLFESLSYSSKDLRYLVFGKLLLYMLSAFSNYFSQ